MIPNQRKDEPCSAKDNGPRPRPDEPCSDAAALFHHSAMCRPMVPLPHPPMDLIGKSRDMNTEVAGISHQGHRYEQVWKITLPKLSIDVSSSSALEAMRQLAFYVRSSVSWIAHQTVENSQPRVPHVESWDP